MLVWDQRWLNRFNEVQPGLIAVDVFGASTLDVWACITMTFIKGVVHSGNVVLSSMNDIQDTDIVLHFLFCIKTKYSGSIKCTLKLISSSLLTFWLTTYLLCFSANSRNFDRYQLCSSSDVLFYSYTGRLHTRVSQRQESSSIF